MPSKTKKASFELVSDWSPRGDQEKSIEQICQKFRGRSRYQTLLGVTGSGKTFVMANAIRNLGMPAIIMAPNKTLAAQLYSEFRNFFPNNHVEYYVSYYDYYQPEAYIPQRDIYIEKEASINPQLDRLRMSATSSALMNRDVIIITSVSCIYSLGDPSDYKSMVIRLKKDKEYDREALLSSLVALQYQRNDFDLARGNFRVRGDVIEIWPAYQEKVLRVEMFGDLIERLVWCNPLDNVVLQEIEQLQLYGANHYVMPREKINNALDSIRQELKEHLVVLKDNDKTLEAARLEARTLYDIEMLEEVGFCAGIENYAYHFSQRLPGERPYCLFDYLQKPFLTIVDESHISVPQVRGMYGGDRSRKTNLIEHGFRLPSAIENRPLRLEEWETVTDKILFVSATPGPYELNKTRGQVVEQIIRPTGLVDPEVEIYSAMNQVPHLIENIHRTIRSGYRTLVTTLTKRLSEDLTQYFQEAGIKVAYLHCDIDAFERVEILQDLRRGKYDVVIGVNLLREGLDLPEVSLVAILDADREGFLRSETSLIQIMGRAARNEHARVILYADKETPAIKKAVAETSRRRKIQLAYNEDHGIQPKSVQKEILQGIDYVLKEEAPLEDFATNVPDDNKEEMIAELQSEMEQAALDLNFEKAAYLRDKIYQLKGVETESSPKKQSKKRKKTKSRTKKSKRSS